MNRGHIILAGMGAIFAALAGSAIACLLGGATDWAIVLGLVAVGWLGLCRWVLGGWSA